MNPDEEVDKILEAIDEYNKIGFTSEELLLMIDEIRPVKIIEIEKEPKTSEKQREYLKNWRSDKKRIEKIKDRELREQAKIEKQLKRTNFLCIKCGRVEISDAGSNTWEYIKKKNDLREKIIISNKCPKCQGIIKLFGGYK